ncbi:MAG: DUF5309 family protein [Muribaculaceae bacterium]|nr:DUF5309 family protein [Muribaculaceae bacterium]
MENSKNYLTDGVSNGVHVSGVPLTTEVTNQAVPGLLTNAIDKAVVKIRPMATPIDQISRMGHVRSVDSMDVDYYSVDTRVDSDSVISAEVSAETAGDDNPLYVLTVSHPSRFEATETFGYGADGVDSVGYVVEKNADGTLLCASVKGDLSELASGGKIIRMGRAATQLDVQSPQFSALPVKNTNYCQIFKMQIEQSVVMKLSHKEIGWDFTDQQEAAVYDMRMGMEKQFLFGKKAKVYDPRKQETVTFTGGIWDQAGKEIDVTLNGFDSKALVDMLRQAFTDNSGSRRKVLIAGSELIAALNRIEHTHVITARDQVTAWGIDFSELQSKFGRLYVVFSDIFDVMGMAGNGIIVDPEYIQKHVFIPFNAERLDLRGSGQRNTEAMVLTEASCLTLRYPEAHARVIGS